MNYARIQQTRIPDLAPVYGGARGRTMSSRHQAYAWRALQEAGVTTIIDLREQDKTERLPALCKEYGMRYFHYPVDTAAQTIAQMVELLLTSHRYSAECLLALLCCRQGFATAGDSRLSPRGRTYFRQTQSCPQCALCSLH